jgi:hypothetical protein
VQQPLPTLSPAIGDTVAHRFVIEAVAGSGGMGTIFRARDLITDHAVALKLLLDPGGAAGELTERFLREARFLSDLRHPGIVAYLAHGQTSEGLAYLAMEWLEGEDLARRLGRSSLSTAESLTLLRVVAGALHAAHRRGVVHRDIKPSNLFLRGGEVARAAVLDFGIARRLHISNAMTRTGAVIGTPAYMAPEQARGSRVITPSADIFSLGCVLFECLTGEPPFVADHIAALLAKVLFDEAPPLHLRRPDLSPDLEDLLRRMLAKEPGARPADGGALLAEMEALGPPASEGPPTRPAPSRLFVLQGAENQLVSVILAVEAQSVPLQGAGALDGGDRPTMTATHFERLRARHDAVARAVAPLGCSVAELADESMVLTLAQTGRMTATELADRAVRCARLCAERWPTAVLAVATGQGVLQKKAVPSGEALDRAGRLLQGAEPPGDAASGSIRLDEVTAGLLDAHYEVSSLRTGYFVLLDERADPDETRRLLGKPMPCLGREQELGILDLVLTACVDEPGARAVLVTAPPGVGKSRLRHEFLRRAGAKGIDIGVFIGRGDPMSAGSSYGLLAQAIRRAAGIADDIAMDDQRARLSALVARAAPEAEALRITEFLGELCGVHFPDEGRVKLHAARQDPHIMGERISAAFLDFLRAECGARPVVFVLEDLHWGDALTVRLLDMALRELAAEPLLVFALARPEVKELFPGLWEGRKRQEIELGGLGKKACERLAAQALGASVSASRIDKIVRHAAGNVLYLEELIRAVAEGKGDEIPQTVLAMLQARLSRLDPGARRVLRAASVFGVTFWRGGVDALVGRSRTAEQVDEALRVLTEAELIVRHESSRFTGEVEYAFRHALMRDAAYSLLIEDDRALGHRLAGGYLEAIGERDPMVLAEHYERGKESSRAGHFYFRAAQQAQWGLDTGSAKALAKRGLGFDIPDKVRGELLSILCEAHGWSGEWEEGGTYAEQVLALAEPSSPAWGAAIPTKFMQMLIAGRSEEGMRTLHLLRDIKPSPEAVPAAAFGLMASMYILCIGGGTELGEEFLGRLRALVEPVAASEPVARGWLQTGRAFWDAWVGDEPWSALRWAREAQASFDEAGHRRGSLTAQIQGGMSLWLLGRHSEAERELRGTVAASPEFGPLTAHRSAYLIFTLADRGALAEARAEALRFLAEANARALPLDEGIARWVVAEVERRAGDFARAEEEARAACKLLEVAPLDGLPALSTLAAVLLARGQPGEALEIARRALRGYEETRLFGIKGSLARLVLAECLYANGDFEGARETIRAARDALLARAARLGDEAERAIYLTAVPEHARTLALAREWLGDP